ncbi:MAG: pantoate--beta-alanine ligase [Bacteriovoracaceae bacterium]|nr:pantoate--beta-alanine ligase [Bacteriovoracaceae bacterium]
MQVFKTLSEWRVFEKEIKELNKSIGFVPTMGALHQGHLSLVDCSKKNTDITVVSIYVNPTQFNNQNDLSNYPMPIERDLQMLEERGVDFVFLPEYELLYSDNYRYRVLENSVSSELCGAHRPGHFDGVLSVVMKLFNIIRPHKAFFGKKDYQQYLLISEMVSAFFMDIEVVPCEIIRESDGLAMSSRNRLLLEHHRKIAPAFCKELASNKKCCEIISSLSEQGFEVDYIEERHGRRFGAVTLGSVRLIDNVKI